jgi:quinol monooxygenase YgiN
MYGTVARMRLRPGVEAQLVQAQRGFESQRVPGFVAAYIYRMDDDPNTCFLTVVFDSKESYAANARSPEQDARFQQIRALLESDPEWHDGEIISSPR